MQTCHNFVGGIRIFSVKIGINLYHSNISKQNIEIMNKTKCCYLLYFPVHFRFFVGVAILKYLYSECADFAGCVDESKVLFRYM